MKFAKLADKIYFFFWRLEYDRKHRNKSTKEIYEEMSDKQLLKLRDGIYDREIHMNQRHIHMLYDEINRRGI